MTVSIGPKLRASGVHGVFCGRSVRHGLVPVPTSESLKVELAYATADNFLGRAVYPVDARAYGLSQAVHGLVSASEQIATHGLGLIVRDCYRPLSVQAQMWDQIRDRRYVSDPATNLGRHSRGTAIDVQPFFLDGSLLELPTPFDDFTELAHRAAVVQWSPQAQWAYRVIDEALTAVGFSGFEFEWWHYDLVDWVDWPAMDLELSALDQGAAWTYELVLA